MNPLANAHALVEGLARNGLRYAVLSPGSRNTPLLIAFAEHPQVQPSSLIDERSAGFFALGLARSLDEPVALCSTSGSAAANYAPALMEAYWSRIPLIALTADRPPSLRELGANQTARQVGLFTPHVKWQIELPLPDGTQVSFRQAAAMAAQALAIAQAEPPGPVHLNLPFAEPLLPPPRRDLEAELAELNPPHLHPSGLPPLGDEALKVLEEYLRRARRPLIVLGPNLNASLAEELLAFAARQRIPLLADILSQARLQEAPAAIGHHDILLSTGWAPKADLILHLGAPPTSQALGRFLASAPVVRIESAPPYRDPWLASETLLFGNPIPWLRSASVPQAEAGWLELWQAADQSAERLIEERASLWWEGTVVRAFLQHLPSPAQVLLGNSRPIRDAEALAWLPLGLRALGNRGVSGIDGVTSSALGASLVERSYLVLGDLSFLHDLGGLFAAHVYALNLTVLVIQNWGGGIFHHLAQASRPEHLHLFTTPHDLDLAPLVRAFGGHHQLLDDRSQLVLESPQGLTVLEARFEGSQSPKIYAELRAELTEGLGRLESLGTDRL